MIMEENSDVPSDLAAREELAACNRLLATTVAQHRAKGDFVAIKNSLSLLRSGAQGLDGPEYQLFIKSSQIVDEALKLAKSYLRQKRALNENEDLLENAENRSQLRINVAAPVKVVWTGSADAVDAQLADISWGGAAVNVAQAHGKTGDTLEIILPSTKGGSITIEAKIIRIWELADGQGVGVATRFSSLSTRDETELENILKMLSDSGDSAGKRKYARFTQRLDIQFDDIDELKATLEDISTGGLKITVPDPLEIGQSFQAVVSTLDERCTIKLRARVVRQESLKLGESEVYEVGLEFEHPSSELKERANELIQEMAAMKLKKE